MGFYDALVVGAKTHIGTTARRLFQNQEKLLAMEEIPAGDGRQFLAAGNDAYLYVLHVANLVIFSNICNNSAVFLVLWITIMMCVFMIFYRGNVIGEGKWNAKENT